MHPFEIPAWFAWTATTVVCGMAIWKGGREVRLAATGFIAAWVFTLVFRDRTWPPVQWGALTADIAYFGLALILALSSRRYWPLFLAGFQLLNVLTSSGPLLVHTGSRWTWATASVIWTYCIMALLMVTAIQDWQRPSPSRARRP